MSSPALAGAPKRTIGVVAMFVAFQGGWFACVLGAAHGWPWAGTLAAAGVAALAIGLGPRPRADAALVAAAIARTPLVLALGWAAITPLLLVLARRLDREQAIPAGAR